MVLANQQNSTANVAAIVDAIIARIAVFVLGP